MYCTNCDVEFSATTFRNNYFRKGIYSGTRVLLGNFADCTIRDIDSSHFFHEEPSDEGFAVLNHYINTDTSNCCAPVFNYI